jgi:hypothetical protein
MAIEEVSVLEEVLSVPGSSLVFEPYATRFIKLDFKP